jgi:hypothetical protein
MMAGTRHVSWWLTYFNGSPEVRSVNSVADALSVMRRRSRKEHKKVSRWAQSAAKQSCDVLITY